MNSIKKSLPVIIFVLVILIVGVTILIISGRQPSTKTQNNINNQNTPVTTPNTQDQTNSNPIDNIDQKYSKGNPKAKVQITEYSDFQCPYCKKGHDTMAQAYDKYKNDIYLTFSNFPLTSIHANALPAAKAAEAAGYQGKFWEMYDLLFANQNNLSKDDLVTYAKKLNMDIPKFEEYFNNKNIEAKILKQEEDAGKTEYDSLSIDKDGKIVSAGKAKIEGTPAFLINGKLVVGAYPFEQFEKFILQALGK